MKKADEKNYETMKYYLFLQLAGFECNTSSSKC